MKMITRMIINDDGDEEEVGDDHNRDDDDQDEDYDNEDHHDYDGNYDEDDDDNNTAISLVENFQEQSRWQLELFDRMEIIFRRTSSLQLHQ